MNKKKENLINLNDLFKVIIKNLNNLYLFIVSGIIIGLIGIAFNSYLISSKNLIETKISIKSPLNNYSIVEIFSLQKISIDKNKIDLLAHDEKIKNYYFMCQEYLKLVTKKIDLEKFKPYETKLIINETNFQITIDNVKSSANEKIESQLIEFVNDINKNLKPIILTNAYNDVILLRNMFDKDLNLENNKFFERFYSSIDKNLKSYEDSKLEIFELNIKKISRDLDNKKIFVITILLSFTLFLMFIILKK